MDKLKIIQFQGLAPSVFCGKYFVDQGSQVVLIQRKESFIPLGENILNKNKKKMSLNLKDKNHMNQLKQLLKTADILIDPFRPKVLQKLGLGPLELCKLNPKIIMLRVSGYGQKGNMSLRPGHDLNYLSISGIMQAINKSGQYQFPSNFMADFVSASLGISGTIQALIKRQSTNIGYIVDCSLTDGCTYLTQLIVNQPFKNKQQIRSIKQNGKQIIYTGLKPLKLNNQQDYSKNQKGEQTSKVKEIDLKISQYLLNPFQIKKLSKL